MSSGCSGSVKGGLKWWDWRSGEKHRELQNPVFVGPVFELEVDFWSILVDFGRFLVGF
jgi:hypothetical protein